MKSILKNLLILVGLALVASVGYYLVTAERASTIDENEALAIDDAERETQAFLRRLNELRSIELSASIFSDARFRSLVDFTAPVEESAPAGRENPFAR